MAVWSQAYAIYLMCIGASYLHVVNMCWLHLILVLVGRYVIPSCDWAIGRTCYQYTFLSVLFFSRSKQCFLYDLIMFAVTIQLSNQRLSVFNSVLTFCNAPSLDLVVSVLLLSQHAILRKVIWQIFTIGFYCLFSLLFSVYAKLTEMKRREI